MAIRDKRKAAGITQREAAQRLGIGLRHYQKIEAGHAQLTRTMAKLAELVMEGDA